MVNWTNRLVAAVALIAVGCGSQDWGYLSGTVKLNGQPVGPGTITLQPVDMDRSGAVASFGSDGNYTVMSAGRKEGAPAGEYYARIQGGAEFGVEGGLPPETKIPARYGRPNSTELTVKIEPGSNTHDFELTP